MDDELVVYDERDDTVHHLNETTAAVWRLCDGSRDIEALRQEVSRDSKSDLPLEIVVEAIALLDAASLLLGPPSDAEQSQEGVRRLSRRQLLIRMGVAAATIPVITTIVAPTPAAAATCAGTCNRVNSPCTGENTAGTGNCRCNVPSPDTGTCVACIADGVTVADAHLCCSLNGVNGSGKCKAPA
jgi:hypothetical protein